MVVMAGARGHAGSLGFSSIGVGLPIILGLKPLAQSWLSLATIVHQLTRTDDHTVGIWGWFVHSGDASALGAFAGSSVATGGVWARVAGARCLLAATFERSRARGYACPLGAFALVLHVLAAFWWLCVSSAATRVCQFAVVATLVHWEHLRLCCTYLLRFGGIANASLRGYPNYLLIKVELSRFFQHSRSV